MINRSKCFSYVLLVVLVLIAMGCKTESDATRTVQSAHGQQAEAGRIHYSAEALSVIEVNVDGHFPNVDPDEQPKGWRVVLNAHQHCAEGQRENVEVQVTLNQHKLDPRTRQPRVLVEGFDTARQLVGLFSGEVSDQTSQSGEITSNYTPQDIAEVWITPTQEMHGFTEPLTARAIAYWLDIQTWGECLNE